jgi:hypothetical protein
MLQAEIAEEMGKLFSMTGEVMKAAAMYGEARALYTKMGSALRAENVPTPDEVDYDETS